MSSGLITNLINWLHEWLVVKHNIDGNCRFCRETRQDVVFVGNWRSVDKLVYLCLTWKYLLPTHKLIGRRTCTCICLQVVKIYIMGHALVAWRIVSVIIKIIWYCATSQVMWRIYRLYESFVPNNSIRLYFYGQLMCKEKEISREGEWQIILYVC